MSNTENREVKLGQFGEFRASGDSSLTLGYLSAITPSNKFYIGLNCKNNYEGFKYNLVTTIGASFAHFAPWSEERTFKYQMNHLFPSHIQSIKYVKGLFDLDGVRMDINQIKTLFPDKLHTIPVTLIESSFDIRLKEDVTTDD